MPDQVPILIDAYILKNSSQVLEKFSYRVVGDTCVSLKDRGNIHNSNSFLVSAPRQHA